MNSFSKTKVLHQVICGILGTSVSGCGGFTSSSCGSGVEQDLVMPTTDWSRIACDSNGKMDLLTGLTPAYQVDGLALYELDRLGVSSINEAGGPPCVNASVSNQCIQSVYFLDQSLSSNALIVTNGDLVTVLQSPVEVKTFLGQLDNPQKVFNWMHVNGMKLSCTFDNSAVIENPDGMSWSGIYTEQVQHEAGSFYDRVRVNINRSDGALTVTARSKPVTCVGRLPPGQLHFSSTSELCDSVGESLARHAAYEAASVIAFEHLHRELSLLGAQPVLLARIEKAIEDERRHAVQVGMLAGRYGKVAHQCSVDPAEIRDIETITIDNMREGCIGETWGALIGLYQAANAKDSVVAKTMHEVALDEVDHASLSWEVHHWLSGQLSDVARERVQQVQHHALQAIVNNAAKPVRPDRVLLLGLPEPRVAVHLAERFVQALSV